MVLRWGAIALAWSLVALVLAAQGHVAFAHIGRPTPFAVHLGIHFTCALIWFAFTPLILKLRSTFPFRRGVLARNVAVHAIASVAFALTSISIFAVTHRSLFPPGSFLDVVRGLAIRELHVDVLKYWSVIGIAQAIAYYRESRERELAASQLEARLSEMRLHALRAQLQPHFLFNALNSIAVLMYEDVKLANAMLVHLSELLRLSLDSGSAHEVTLRRELEFVDRYLAIERIRFSDRLQVAVSVDPSVLDARVPHLLLQPLVENSIRHGIARQERGGRIEMSARHEGDTLRLRVRDDGPGISAGAKRGVGVSNTGTRLQQLYGENHSFVVGNDPAGGAAVDIAVPLRFAPS